MGLKTSFEDSNVISSPFVDEIANPGAVARVRSTIKKVLDDAKTDAEISRRADAKSKPKKKSTPKVRGFAEPGLKNRRDFINSIR